ncbi:MAG: DinB family protein [Thermoanaerobaculia bacterium]
MNSRLIEFAEHYWAEYLGKIEQAVAPLSDDALWWRGPDANAASNSIANLLAHLHGNLSQWVLAGLGGQPFERHRSEEFVARPGPGAATKAELVEMLQRTVGHCRETIRGLSEGELARVRKIQKYELDGYRALFHTVEHMSYHTGQIVLLAKLQGVGLDFYPQHKGE